MKFCSICRKPLNQCQCAPEQIKQWRAKQEAKIDEKIRKLDHLEEEIQQYRERQKAYQIRLNEVQCTMEMKEDDWAICRMLWDKGYRLNLEETFFGTPENPVISVVFSENYPLDYHDVLAEEFWKYRKYRRKMPVELGPEDFFAEENGRTVIRNNRMIYWSLYTKDWYWGKTEYRLSFHMSRTQQNELKQQQVIPADFFMQQKKAFCKWVEQLPPVSKKDDTDSDFVIENGVLVKYTGKSSNVIIPDTVTVIGENAFFQCETIYTVMIPDSVVRIEKGAFSGCFLSHVELSQKLEYIGDFAFGGCEFLKELILPDSLKEMGEGVFQRCTRLILISFSKNLTEIPDSTFWGCSALACIQIPANIRRIGEFAFYQCKSLIHIDFSEGLEIIDEGAFSECISLKRIALPNSVRELRLEAFAYCCSLIFVHLPEQLEGCLVDTFSECYSLRTLQLPENLAELAGTFNGCTSLKEMELPKGLTSIGVWLFRDCTSLHHVRLNTPPKTVP